MHLSELVRRSVDKGRTLTLTAKLITARCDAVIVEFNPYHFETIPAIIEQLNRNGFRPLLLINRLGIESGFFDHLDRNLNFRLFTLPEDRTVVIPFIRWFLKKRMVIWNTLEPRSCLDWIMTSFKGSLLGRSVGLFHNPGACRGWVGIAVHLHPSFSTTNDQFLPLFRFTGIADHAEHDSIVLGVVGNLELFRRNYESLFLALGELPAQDRARFKVVIWGRELGQATVEVRALADRYSSTLNIEILSHEFLNQAAFNEKLSQCDYVLPLIDDTEDRFSKYFSNSMTGSIITSIAARRPLVMNRRLAQLYGLEDVAICYDRSFLKPALQKLLPDGNNEPSREALDRYYATQRDSANDTWARILSKSGAR